MIGTISRFLLHLMTPVGDPRGNRCSEPPRRSHDGDQSLDERNGMMAGEG
jgi:hypothetical protein